MNFASSQLYAELDQMTSNPYKFTLKTIICRCVCMCQELTV